VNEPLIESLWPAVKEGCVERPGTEKTSSTAANCTRDGCGGLAAAVSAVDSSARLGWKAGTPGSRLIGAAVNLLEQVANGEELWRDVVSRKADKRKERGCRWDKWRREKRWRERKTHTCRRKTKKIPEKKTSQSYHK
jgi:hypothetical protein